MLGSLVPRKKKTTLLLGPTKVSKGTVGNVFKMASWHKSASQVKTHHPKLWQKSTSEPWLTLLCKDPIWNVGPCLSPVLFDFHWSMVGLRKRNINNSKQHNVGSPSRVICLATRCKQWLIHFVNKQYMKRHLICDNNDHHRRPHRRSYEHWHLVSN